MFFCNSCTGLFFGDVSVHSWSACYQGFSPGNQVVTQAIVYCDFILILSSLYETKETLLPNLIGHLLSSLFLSADVLLCKHSSLWSGPLFSKTVSFVEEKVSFSILNSVSKHLPERGKWQRHTCNDHSRKFLNHSYEKLIPKSTPSMTISY